MSKVRFISDLHLGHRNICQFAGALRGGCKTVEEHDQWIKEQWNSVVNKNDVVWVLGDVAFDKNAMRILKQMKGNKHMIWGNHDLFGLDEYRKYFNVVTGFRKKYGIWLSHSPIHPQELRGKINIHGHVHSNSVPHNSYFNACVEPLRGLPITLDELKQRVAIRKQSEGDDGE